MEEYENLKRLIRGMGLNEYQTEAYLSLLIYGDLTAEEISEYGKIPLPRVYDTLKDLCNNMGIVLISHSRPKVYKAMDPEIAIRKLVKFRKDSLENMLESIEKDASTLLKELRSSSRRPQKSDEKAVWYYRIKGDPLGAERRLLQQNAAREYLSFSGDMSWLKDDKEHLRGLMKKRIDIKVLASKSKVSGTTLKLAKSLRIPVRLNSTNVRGEIVDGRTAVLVAKRFNGMKTDYEVLKTDNPLVVSLIREHFLDLWKDAARVD